MIKKDDLREMIKSGYLRGFLQPQLSRYELRLAEMGTYQGVVFLDLQKEENASPVFNLDKAYDNIYDSRSIEEAAERLANMMGDFIEKAPQYNIDVKRLREIMSSYDTAKNMIIMDPVSYNYTNSNVIIHEKNGMKFVPKILIGQDGETKMVSPVPAKWLKEQNVSKEQIINDAINNTEVVFPAVIRSMGSIMQEYNVDGLTDSAEFQSANMYVITNERKQNGASLILSNSVLDTMSQMYGGSDFFVIPSSIHEIITIPVNQMNRANSETLKYMIDMVSEVNGTIPDNEILGYDISIYNAGAHALEKATDYCINRQIDKVRELHGNELKSIDEEHLDMRYNVDDMKFKM